jgi:hypothetical protein
MTKPDTAVIPFYQVDAFTTQPFGGNPAGVCPLTEWLPDDVLQAIATENNLSETAFLCRSRKGINCAGVRLRLKWIVRSCHSRSILGAVQQAWLPTRDYRLPHP